MSHKKKSRKIDPGLLVDLGPSPWQSFSANCTVPTAKKRWLKFEIIALWPKHSRPLQCPNDIPSLTAIVWKTVPSSSTTQQKYWLLQTTVPPHQSNSKFTTPQHSTQKYVIPPFPPSPCLNRNHNGSKLQQNLTTLNYCSYKAKQKQNIESNLKNNTKCNEKSRERHHENQQFTC